MEEETFISNESLWRSGFCDTVISLPCQLSRKKSFIHSFIQLFIHPITISMPLTACQVRQEKREQAMQGPCLPAAQRLTSNCDSG